MKNIVGATFGLGCGGLGCGRDLIEVFLVFHAIIIIT